MVDNDVLNVDVGRVESAVGELPVQRIAERLAVEGNGTTDDVTDVLVLVVVVELLFVSLPALVDTGWVLALVFADTWVVSAAIVLASMDLRNVHLVHTKSHVLLESRVDSVVLTALDVESAGQHVLLLLVVVALLLVEALTVVHAANYATLATHHAANYASLATHHAANYASLATHHSAHDSALLLTAEVLRAHILALQVFRAVGLMMHVMVVSLLPVWVGVAAWVLLVQVSPVPHS